MRVLILGLESNHFLLHLSRIEFGSLHLAAAAGKNWVSKALLRYFNIHHAAFDAHSQVGLSLENVGRIVFRSNMPPFWSITCMVLKTFVC